MEEKFELLNLIEEEVKRLKKNSDAFMKGSTADLSLGFNFGQNKVCLQILDYIATLKKQY